jgi:hypothetical protein
MGAKGYREVSECIPEYTKSDERHGRGPGAISQEAGARTLAVQELLRVKDIHCGCKVSRSRVQEPGRKEWIKE